jgi:hypothetical protein
VGESARTPGAVAWPEQMITRAEAFGLAAEWPVYVQHGEPGNLPEDDMDTALRCGKCHQSTGQLYHAGTTYNGSLDEMLSMVLRHMVMAHDVPLAGLRRTEPGPCTGAGCDHVSHGA